MPEGEQKLEGVESRLNVVTLHTSTEGQLTLKSQWSALQGDLESLKALLSKTSIQIGKLFLMLYLLLARLHIV